MLQADAILEKMKNNGMMKEIVDSQETTLMITADQVCSLRILKRALLYNISWADEHHTSFIWIQQSISTL